MRNVVVCFVILGSLLSCANSGKKEHKKSETVNDTIKKTYYDESKKNLKEITLKEGLIKKFYKNGTTFSEGKVNDKNQKIGQWKFYTKEGKLSEMREFFVINGRSYLNQNLYFSENDEYWNALKDDNFNKYDQSDFSSDTLDYRKSFYAQFDLGKDTIDINEPWRAVCFYYTPIFKEQNSESIVILSTNEDSFKSDFSNWLEVKKDTFYSLRKNIENRKWFPDDDIDNTVVFGRYFDTPGKKIIRGYLSEFYVKDGSGKKNHIEEKLTFFEREIFVKDSI